MDNSDDSGTSSFAEIDSSSFSGSQHSRWPYVDLAAQRAVEKRLFEDGATIHFERLGGFSLPRPFLYTDRHRAALILRYVMGAAKGTGRRLTAEEVDAVSEHAAKSVVKCAFAEPTAIGAAAAAAADGRRTFRFLFYQPKANSFNPTVFPSRSIPLLRGAKAIASWHFVRFLSYYPVTLLVSLAFFHSMSSMIFGVKLQRDPRLTAVARDTIATALKTPGATRPPGAPLPSPTERRVNYPGAQSPPVQQPQSSSRSQAAGNGTAPVPEPPQWYTAQAPAQEPKASNPPAYPAENPSWDADPFEDDASPVAPAARRAEAAAREQSSGGVSSWAKIRQQAQSGSGASGSFAKGDSSGREWGWAQLRQDKAPNTAEGAQGTEQFSYSKQDEEKERRNYEKDQAQKEFDALLDAERRGESSTRGRR